MEVLQDQNYQIQLQDKRERVWRESTAKVVQRGNNRTGSEHAKETATLLVLPKRILLSLLAL